MNMKESKTHEEFETQDKTSAPDASREMLEAVESQYGFIPNLMGMLAKAPAALKAYLALGEAFGETSLTPVEQQVVLLSVSRHNGCSYCMAAHSAVAKMSGMADEDLQALRAGDSLSDSRLEALRSFTSAVQETRGQPPSEEMANFLGHGFTRGQVLEVLVGVAMKTLSNYTNHLAGTALDEEFAEFRWDGA